MLRKHQAAFWHFLQDKSLCIREVRLTVVWKSIMEKGVTTLTPVDEKSSPEARTDHRASVLQIPVPQIHRAVDVANHQNKARHCSDFRKLGLSDGNSAKASSCCLKQLWIRRVVAHQNVDAFFLSGRGDALFPRGSHIPLDKQDRAKRVKKSPPVPVHHKGMLSLWQPRKKERPCRTYSVGYALLHTLTAPPAASHRSSPPSAYQSREDTSSCASWRPSSARRMTRQTLPAVETLGDVHHATPKLSAAEVHGDVQDFTPRTQVTASHSAWSSSYPLTDERTNAWWIWNQMTRFQGHKPLEVFLKFRPFYLSL